VNQVFEILLKWVEGRDWEKAFYEVIPQRKFAVVNSKEAESTSTGEND
jgi:tRNA (guanine9-N1)-methyltransferase